MRKLRLASALILTTSIVGAAWAYQPAAVTPVTGRFTSGDSTAKKFTVETSAGDITFKTDGRTVFMRLESRVSLSDLKVGDQIRVTYRNAVPVKIAAHVETIDAGTASSKTVSGCVTSVDVSAGKVTIDMADAPNALSSINTGDRVRFKVGSDGLTANRIDVLPGAPRDAEGMRADGIQPLKTGGPRSLGLWLLAMTGTAVVLRARRSRTI